MLIGAVMLRATCAACAARAERRCSICACCALRTFEAGILGGAFFRFGVGASAFLLPLMLQLGFGLDPLQLGSASRLPVRSARSMVKPLARSFLLQIRLPAAADRQRTAGLPDADGARTVQAGDAAPSSFGRAAVRWVSALAGVHEPLRHHLRRGGNAAGRAATGMASVAQQVSVSLGVAIGAMVLEMSDGRPGGEPRRWRTLPPRSSRRVWCRRWLRC